MWTRTITLSVAFFLVLVLGAQAQTQKPHLIKLAPPLKEMIQYQQQNITPFVQKLRVEIDQELPAADRRELDQLRTQLNDLRMKQRARFLKNRQTRNQATDEQKADLLAERALHKKLLEQLTQIARRNEVVVRGAEDKFNVQRQIWLADLKAIAAAAGHSEKENKPNRKARSRTHAFTSWNTTRFLLLDPSQQQNTLKENLTSPTRGLLSISPNPVTDKATLTYRVTQSGKVTIELLDQQGNLVRKVKESTLTPGQQQMTFEAASLPNGLYICRVTTATGMETIRFLKQ